MTSSNAVDKIETKFQDHILDKSFFRGEFSLTVDKLKLVEIMSYCKDELLYDYLVDITAIDNLGIDPRY
ncbi:MAG: NADH-quinone oxidoreductase subunit C, partial [Verrucomicrobiota bacterium]|nr:NADH-quinone oxidoreductase subunit C [Verrucomicrobiota bacterium]